MCLKFQQHAERSVLDRLIIAHPVLFRSPMILAAGPTWNCTITTHPAYEHGEARTACASSQVLKKALRSRGFQVRTPGSRFRAGSRSDTSSSAIAPPVRRSTWHKTQGRRGEVRAQTE